MASIFAETADIPKKRNRKGVTEEAIVKIRVEDQE
jgi:hypothetical protein